jgi:hypothetical protein
MVDRYTADGAVVAGLQGPPGTGDLLLGLDHPDVTFRLVVVVMPISA